MSKLTKFREKLNATGFDSTVITSKINRFCLSEFSFDDGYVVVTPEMAYVITDSRYEEVAHIALDENPEWEVIVPKGMHGAITEKLKADGAKSVAFEETDISLALYERLKTKISDEVGDIVGKSNTVGCSSLLTELRIYKSAEEVEFIKKAQAITDAAFANLLKTITHNMTEIEVALELELYMRRAGADGVAFETIAVNAERSSRPHGVPTTEKLQHGFLTMDFGAKFGGYCSDMTRTICIGNATPEEKHLYNTVLEAQLLALDKAAYGIKCSDIDKAARDHIYANGYEGKFGHGLGHGVGLLIHEAPRFSPMAGDATFEVGHVVTVEPGIYLPGQYGCRIEDMIYLDKDKNVIDLTHSPKELIEI